MSTINPKFSNPEPIKLEIDQFQSVTAERVKNMKMEAELGNLARERDLLKKEVDVLEKTQRYLELEKCSLEEKLGRSERRCEELEEKVEKARQKKLNLKEKLDWSRTKCEELRCKEIETARAVDELRLKKMESGKASELDKSRLCCKFRIHEYAISCARFCSVTFIVDLILLFVFALYISLFFFSPFLFSCLHNSSLCRIAKM